MRHALTGNTLGRYHSLRRATLRDLAKATLTKQRICTTKAKAKEARKLIDKLITLGKKGSLSDKRRAFALLCDHTVVSDLFGKISPRFKNRIGGYTRIIPLGNRRGDNAQMVYLELTEKEEVIISKPKTTASAKKETLQPITAEPKKEKVEQAAVKEKEPKKPKAQEHKEETPKSEVKREPPTQEKPRRGFIGGLKNIFQRRKSPNKD